jgi:rubrerythrin
VPDQQHEVGLGAGGSYLMFRNFYWCEKCGHEWNDLWECKVDDDCPVCGARHMSPYKSEDEGA